MERQRAIGWVAHPHILRGEAFSSWLARYAWANGLSPHCFTRTAFGEVAIWTRDIDRTVDAATLVKAGQLPGISPRRLAGSTMRVYQGRVFAPEFAGAAFIPWITPLGVYHRTRRRHGSAYCPECLREFGCMRLDWRLAWMVHCPRHERPLLDACPECDAPFVFHRMSLADRRRFPCIACGFDLGRAPTGPVVAMTARHLQRALTCCAAGHPRRIGTREVSALEFTAGVRVLLRGLYANAHLEGLANGLHSARRAYLGRPRAPGRTSFEHWRIHDRAVAIAYLFEVLRCWPETFLRSLRTARVCPSRLGSERIPDWIADALSQLSPSGR